MNFTMTRTQILIFGKIGYFYSAIAIPAQYNYV